MDELSPKPSTSAIKPDALKDRVLATLRFFSLQGIPLTLFEVHKCLLGNLDTLRQAMDSEWEIKDISQLAPVERVSLSQVQSCLERDCSAEAENFRGFYYLSTQDKDLVTRRLHNYFYGVQREHLIRRYARGLKYLPFIRGVGLVGSQALGQYKPGSDIDLLIIAQSGFLWLARLFITSYFQIFGIRRHGRHIANRFCLNHYLAGPKALNQDRNIYTASEYAKLRPLYPSAALGEFKFKNSSWVQLFFPHFDVPDDSQAKTARPRLQCLVEALFANRFGRWLEGLNGRLQLSRIQRDQFVVVETDELSFHPDNRKRQLFRAFFEDQQ